ncbi:MAG: hypothetical protein ACK481_00405 [Candidatus Melainabacteria bacterium]|jgi:hypothetical protein
MLQKIFLILFLTCISCSLIAQSDSITQSSAQELIEDSGEIMIVKGNSEKRLCPPDYPIKGNVNSFKGTKIYHLPSGAFYERTNPEQCFSNTAEAAREGFRPSER